MKSTNIRVSVRIRPLPDAEKGQAKFAKVKGQNVVQEVGTTNGFPFDDVFDPTTGNVDIFKKIGTRVVERLVDGYNATVFMYGQTGSGKTHTMLGTPEDEGLLPRTSRCIFETIEGLSSSKNFLLRCRYVEIYNENTYDLLNSRKKVELKLVNDAFIPDGAKDMFVRSFEDLDKILKLGAQTKTMGVSNINEHSSRSHTIFSLVMESQGNDGMEDTLEDEVATGTCGEKEELKLDEGEESDPLFALEAQKRALPAPSSGGEDASMSITAQKNGVIRVSTMNLVDLAGSESFAMEKGHSQQQETKAINKSLSALKSVVVALSKKEKFVPYRNSALTKMLKSSLGGNAETDIITTLHNGEAQLKQSKYTIEFGSLANKIVCKVQENVASKDDKILIRTYKNQLKKLAEKLRAAEELAKQKQALDSELLSLAHMQKNMIMSPRAANHNLDQILQLERKLKEEKEGRLAALDSAASRDAYVAETLQRHERVMEDRMTSLRIQLEEERHQLLVEQDTMRQSMTMERQDLREVVDLRRALQDERAENQRLRQALDNAESTVMELTLQMTLTQSQMASASGFRDLQWQ